MADKKNSIVESAMLDIKTIQEALDQNTKGILHNLALGEIDSVVKKSVNESLYEEEDVDDEEVQSDDSIEVGAEADADAEEITPDVEPEMGVDMGGADLDNLDVDSEEGGLDDYGAEEGGIEDYEMDMTGASDDEVLNVYKKLSGDDEIEVVSDNEVLIKDPVSGAEYQVKFGGGNTSEVGYEGGESGIEGIDDYDAEEEISADTDVPPMSLSTSTEPEMGDEEGMEDDDDELGEGVVFEIEMGDDDAEEIAEDIVRGKGHESYATKGKMETGDIEGTKAPVDSELGDNLEGGFDDDAVKYAKAEGPMVMGESDDDDAEELDEAIPVGNAQGRRVPGKATPIKGAGAQGLEEANKKYNALLAEARKIKKENDELKVALNKFRRMLGESVVFNSNLSYVTRLFMEHSTTLAEKKIIVGRFDEEVSTIKESKKLYKTISNELGSKKPMIESVENKIIKEGTSSVSNQITESTVDKGTSRINDLIKRVEQR